MQVGVVRQVNPIVKKLLQTFSRPDAEVMAAFRTRLQIFIDSLAPDNLPTRIALLPQPFGTYVLLTITCWCSLDRRFLPCEPGHVNSATTVTRVGEPPPSQKQGNRSNPERCSDDDCFRRRVRYAVVRVRLRGVKINAVAGFKEVFFGLVFYGKAAAKHVEELGPVVEMLARRGGNAMRQLC